jgi:hypothetical protein
LIPENELSRGAGVEISPVTGGPIVNEAMETSVKGIFACGNVVHVHDLVDWVTEESRRAGKNAADFVLNKLKDDELPIITRPGRGVRYIVPHRIRLDNVGGKLDLMLRVDNIYHNVKLVVRDGEKVIKAVKKLHLAPGEMESIVLAKSELERVSGKEISIQLEEV